MTDKQVKLMQCYKKDGDILSPLDLELRSEKNGEKINVFLHGDRLKKMGYLEFSIEPNGKFKGWGYALTNLGKEWRAQQSNKKG